MAIGIIGVQKILCQTVEPNYEQIAFDFYRSEIQPKYPTKKRIKVWRELMIATDDPFWFPKCLDRFKLTGADSLNQQITTRKMLDVSDLDKKKYRIKSKGKGKVPVVFVNKPFTIKGLNIFINITELHKQEVYIYHIELAKNGEILDWCRGGYVY